MGLIPAGAYRNREFFQPTVHFDPSVDRIVQDIFFDPQTSGGLLICVDKNEVDGLLEALKEKGVQDSAIIGEVISEPIEKIFVN
jgi:selenide,water dikinase